MGRDPDRGGGQGLLRRQQPGLLGVGSAHVGAEERVRRPDQPPEHAQARHHRRQRLRHGRRLRDRAPPATWSWPTRPPGSRSARSGSGWSRARAAWSGCPHGAGQLATEMILTGRRSPPPRPWRRPGQPGGPGRDRPGRRPRLAAEIGEGSPTSVRVSLRIMEETRGIPDVIEAVGYPSRASTT